MKTIRIVADAASKKIRENPTNHKAYVLIDSLGHALCCISFVGYVFFRSRPGMTSFARKSSRRSSLLIAADQEKTLE